MAVRLVLALIVSGAFQSSAWAEYKVRIWYEEGDIAQHNCAIALHATAATARIAGLTIEMEAHAPGSSNAVQPAAVRIDLTGLRFQEAALSVAIDVGQVFRDAAHFQIFVQSDLFKRLQHIDRNKGVGSVSWLAMAYGGYYHLFSRDRALTEPAHFKGQLIGGAEHARVYDSFQGTLSSAALFYSSFGRQLSAGDLEKFGQREVPLAGVEAPVINAGKLGLEQKAKFVNLTYSAVYPVVFQVFMERFYPVEPNARAKVLRWASSAAQSCSAENYRAEQASLDRLRSAGLQIVPVNRAALVEPSWRHGISWVITGMDWTTRDLDEIVSMGAKPKRLPSALVAGLPAKARKELSAQTKKIDAERKPILAAMRVLPLHEALRQEWSDERDALVVELSTAAKSRKLPPPRIQPDGPRAKPKVASPDVARGIVAEMLKYAEMDAEKENCGGRCVDAVEAFCTAARVSWALDDAATLRKLLNRADALTRRSNPQEESLGHELVSLARAKVLIGDPGAAAAIDRAAASILKHERGYWTVQHLAKLAVLAQSINQRQRAEELFKSALEAAGRDSGELLYIADEYRNAGNMDAAASLLISALEATPSPGKLVRATYLGSLLWPGMPARAAEMYDRLGEAQRPIELRSENRNRQAIWEDSLDEDWPTHFKNSAWMWGSAKEPQQLAALKAKLQVYEKTAPASAADSFKYMYRDIDKYLAEILFERGDIAGSRAADGGAAARRIERTKRAKDPSQWEALLAEAIVTIKSSERDRLLRDVAEEAAASGNAVIARRAVMQTQPSSMWEWKAGVIAVSGIGY